MKTWSVQPTLKCPKGLCPGGYLKDGVHNCSGPTIPSPSYPGPPSLSIGGELDGLVRMSRMAEAWYTQQATQHKVKLVLGSLVTSFISVNPLKDKGIKVGTGNIPSGKHTKSYRKWP